MKLLLALFLTINSFSIFGQNVFVDGHTRSDGTYVAPHVRSAPDDNRWNNYGNPSTQDREEQQVTPNRDYDRDGLYNRFDLDDDNDGLSDDYEE